MGKIKKQDNNNPSASNQAENPSDASFPTTAEWILLLVLSAFMVMSLFLVNDYGMNIDSQKNFTEGEMNLDYFLYGLVDQHVLEWQMHGSLIFMLSDAVKRLLSDRLHLYNPLSARHIILPAMTTCFLAVFFLFVKRNWSSRHGLAAVGFLLTFPAFWGHTFNNLKDIPLLIFFSLTIMSFVEWQRTGKRIYFYGSFILWGLALSIKLYAFLVPFILLAWVLLRPKNSMLCILPSSHLTRTLHIAAGILISSAIVLAFYAPAFWGVDDKLSYIAAWHKHLRELTYENHRPFNVISLTQIFFRTPVMLLIFSVAGMFISFKNEQRSPLYHLLLFWTALPILIHCLPNTQIYNGLRHFIVFLVPFSVFAVVGLFHAAAFIGRVIKINATTLSNGAALIIIGINLWGIVETHPYQTTFFNAFAGGLKGAQNKAIPDTCDYWLNSYKEAGQWISKHAEANATVIAVYGSGTLNSFNTELIKQSVQRPDLNLLRLPVIPAKQDKILLPGNTYVIMVPFQYLLIGRLLLERSEEFQKVHRIERQGGEICSIYYKPKSLKP